MKDFCENCEGKNRVRVEGEILKKQKKGGVFKKYWFSLLGKELYCKIRVIFIIFLSSLQESRGRET